MTFFDTYFGTYVPLANAANLLDLVGRLHTVGAFAELRTPCELPTIAERADLSPDAARAMVDALVLLEVLRPEGGGYVLTEPWMTLTGPGALIPLSSVVAGRDATGRVLRELGVRDYWEVSAEDRLALARAVSLDPYSDALVDAYRARLAADARTVDMLEGGRLLELGCGVAGRCLLTLRAAPALHAVGVELSADLAAEAERRAQDLGLTDRFTVVCGDAAEFVADEPFDYGFWSQFFFPDEARGPALRTLFASLRPGAVLQAPVGESHTADVDPEVARSDALLHTMFRAWGVPSRTADGLKAEFASAGFVDISVVAREAGPSVFARRP